MLGGSKQEAAFLEDERLQLARVGQESCVHRQVSRCRPKPGWQLGGVKWDRVHIMCPTVEPQVGP